MKILRSRCLDLVKTNLYAEEQIKTSNNIILNIQENYNLFYSSKLEEIFYQNEITFELINNIVKVVRNNQEKLTFIIIPAFKDYKYYGTEFNIGFNYFPDKSRRDILPYIEYSFPENYTNPHNTYYNHCFIILLTQHTSHIDSEDYVAKIISKVCKLKSFI